MNWPETVHLSEIQSRLLHDGVPVERAMHVVSEVGSLQHGDRYRVRDGLFFYALGAGYYRTATE